MSTDQVIKQNTHNEAFDYLKRKIKIMVMLSLIIFSGCFSWLGDKIRRMQSITASGIKLINTESLRDTLLDLHNYSAMAIMLIDEKDKLNKSLPSPPLPSPPLPSPPLPSGLHNDIINCNGDYYI